ncbi:lysozyme inhibitor LprI family protein [Novosphingobium fuchskuhlense]|nr:hypothetical protein [Novosphingobium fuchskuhlense]
MKAIQKLLALPVLSLAAGLCSVVSLPSPAHAGPITSPSFDCSKASTPQERLVCGDDELARLDVAMMQAFRMARDSAPDRQVVIDGQRVWLRNSFRTCSDKACLTSAYRSRIAQLRGVAQASPPQSSAPAPSSNLNRIFMLSLKCAGPANLTAVEGKARGEASWQTFQQLAEALSYSARIAGHKMGLTYDQALDRHQREVARYRGGYDNVARSGDGAQLNAFMQSHQAIQSQCAAAMKNDAAFKQLTELGYEVYFRKTNLDQATTRFMVR